jgi:hypothetical protein
MSIVVLVKLNSLAFIWIYLYISLTNWNLVIDNVA